MSFFFFIHWGRKKILPPEEKGENSESNEIIIIPGAVEITLSSHDIVALNLDSPVEIKSSLQEIIEQIKTKEGLAILAHPSYLLKPYSRRTLLKLRGYLGMEIYNPSKIPWPESTRRWDFILTRKYGERIWGFTSDDMHDLKRDAGRAWVMVKAERNTLSSIFESLKQGSFYSTTGPLIEEIGSSTDCIQIKIKNPAKFKFIGYNHQILQVNFCKEAIYRIKPGDKYVRIEIKDLKDKKKAWTQPIFVHEGRIIYFPYFAKGEWLKGCLHLHTEIDGGTARLSEVTAWYKKHNYHFLAITEHNFITHPKYLVKIVP
ncbi:MAG: hypothetical protein ACK4NT_02065 [Candidatus Omnitrophota bacterium]